LFETSQEKQKKVVCNYLKELVKKGTIETGMRKRQQVILILQTLFVKHNNNITVTTKPKEIHVHLAQGSFSSHRSFVSRAVSASAIPSSVNSTELSLSSTL
jgi:hypothetical protein